MLTGLENVRGPPFSIPAASSRGVMPAGESGCKKNFLSVAADG